MADSDSARTRQERVQDYQELVGRGPDWLASLAAARLDTMAQLSPDILH